MTTEGEAPVGLPASTPNGRARAAALQAHVRDSAAVGTVAFSSLGNLLIIGPLAEASACGRALPALRCALLVPPGGGHAAAAGPAAGVVAEGRVMALAGHLGTFSIDLDCAGRRLDAARLFGAQSGHVDLVLDLGDPPALAHELPPLGYFAPRDARALDAALAELGGLVGEFEKPQFFAYDPDICAHGRSGLAGCRRCIDACPTLAIRSLGETIAVDPYLCQGAGSCASACPTGAIRYAYPGAAALLTSVRDALRRYREAGGAEPQALFFAGAAAVGPRTGDLPAALAAHLPESVLPFRVEEIGSVGMDAWLATLAYGARRVVLFTTEAVPRSVLREISLQLSCARAILAGLGYRRDCLQLALNGDREDILLGALADEPPLPALAPGGFAPFDDKRTTLALAIDHLHAHAPEPRPMADLPDDAPFGAIDVDAGLCTLCMACVSVCPAKALYAGNARPALQFIEANCVQCGLCHTACPEDAVRLVPRIDFDRARSRALRTLHEEAPFRCVRCGKPFATGAMVRRMAERLEGHWMFRDPRARRRIGMCQDCRVLDALEQEDNPNVYDRPRAGA